MTKDEETEINLYVSSSSLKTLKKNGEAAANAIDNLVNESKLSAESGERVNGILEKLEEIDQESLRICLSGGSSSGWLHDIFFTPVYAAGDGCVVRFLGAERLYNKDGTRISEEEHAQLRQVLALQAKEKIQELVHNIELYEKKFPNSDALNEFRRKLETNLGYFALCADDNHWQEFVSSTPLLQNDAYKRSLEVAQAYRQSVDSFVEKHGSFANKNAEEVAQLRNKNPALFNALAKRDYSQIDDAVVDGTLLLFGAANEKDFTPEQRQNAIKVAARGIASARYKFEKSLSGDIVSSLYLNDEEKKTLASLGYITSEIQNNLSSEEQEFFNSELKNETSRVFSQSGLSDSFWKSLTGKQISVISEAAQPFIDPDTGEAKVVSSGEFYNPGTGQYENVELRVYVDIDTGIQILRDQDGNVFRQAGEDFDQILTLTGTLTGVGQIAKMVSQGVLKSSTKKVVTGDVVGRTADGHEIYAVAKDGGKPGLMLRPPTINITSTFLRRLVLGQLQLLIHQA